MKKVLNYILLLAVMFIFPQTVLAEPFRYIEIDSGVNLTYTIDGETKTHNVELCTSGNYGYGNVATEYAANVTLYQVGADGTKTEISKSNSPCTSANSNGSTNNTRKLRYERSWNNQFNTDNKYVLEYKVVTDDGNTFVYKKEISYDSTSDDSFYERHSGYYYYGTVVKINDTIEGDHISPKLKITKNLEKIEKDGTFTFNIKSFDDENDVGTNVNVTTDNLTGSLEGIKLAPNKKYKITEVLDENSEYKLVSFKNGEETITTNELVIETGDWGSGDISITATNGPRVEHNKTIEDNHDGTYTLSLDVKGENVTGNANKANVVIIYDISGSMKYYVEDVKGRWGTSNEKRPASYDDYYETNRTLYYRDKIRAGSSFNDGTYYYHKITDNTYEGQTYFVDNSNRVQPYNGVRYRDDETRVDAANNAITNSEGTGLIDRLLDYNTKEGNDSDTVEVALIKFSDSANAETFSDTNNNWTTNKNSFVAKLPEDANDVEGGTNWEHALIIAKNIADAKKRSGDNDQTYIIFITDGNPTYYVNGGNGSGADDDNVAKSYDAADDRAKAIVDSPNGYILYDIGIYGNANLMRALTIYAYDSQDAVNSYYFDATNASKLHEAFDTILTAIERAGIGSVSIFDGTTHSVSVSTEDTVDLLTIDEEAGYEYWLSFPIQSDGTIKFNEEVVTLTKIDDTHYTLSYGDGKTIPNVVGYVDTETNTFHYKWESANELYDVAPPAAHLDKKEYLDELDGNGNKIKNPEFGAVKWDLQSAGILLNDVTYSVKFNVWPSQYTYNLIAGLKNGANYGDLPENIKKYLRFVDGNYVLYTNTTATVSYTDSRGNTGTITNEYKNPEPVGTGVASIGVKKDWVNLLDNTKESSIVLNVTRDGEKYGTSIELSDTGNPETSWQGSVYIAVGSISVEMEKQADDTYKPIKARVLEKGYDYSFAEDDYHWDLEVDTMHPMMINNHLTMLVKTDDKTVADIGSANVLVDGNNTYYVINNKVYKVVTDTNNTFTVTNHRKSNLNLIKEVDGTIPESTTFTFKIKVNSPTDSQIYFGVQDYSDLSIPEDDRPFITDELNTTAKREEKYVDLNDTNVELVSNTPSTADSMHGTLVYKYKGTQYTVEYFKVDGTKYIYDYTNYFVFNNNTEITVNLKPNWNLRFTSLEKNTTYQFIEVLDTAKFKIDDSVVKVTYKDVNGNMVTKTISDDVNALDDITLTPSIYSRSADLLTLAGTIYTNNRNFLAQYKNISLKNYLTIEKKWVDNNNPNRPTSLTVNLTGTVDGEEVNSQEISFVKTSDEAKENIWTYTVEVDRYHNNREIDYSADELVVPLGYVMSKGVDDLHIINTLSTNISGTKTWLDNNNVDGHRPEDIVVILTGKVGNTVVVEPIR